MERRLQSRQALSVRVRMTAPGIECEGLVRDINVRGIFLELEQERLDTAARGVRLHFEIDTGSQVLSRQISGRIVRNEGDGVAIRFAEHDLLARAIVRELLDYLQLYDGVVAPIGECADMPAWLRSNR
ncbi:MAG: PilZ domain-containing protein [Pseudomonadota bacterium]